MPSDPTHPTPPPADASSLRRLGLRVLERGWLSSNAAVFDDGTLVDTGYVAHAAQTVALVEHALAGRALAGIVNTHLHSDHCGGNAALQQRWPRAHTRVPEPSLAAVQAWDAAALSFEATQQRCDRFRADAALVCGETIVLGAAPWQVLPAPGHDPHAVMLWQPDERVLIAGDALWRDGVAVIFPELDGAAGFGPAAAVLDRIEALGPAWVVPGHGEAFADVGAALAQARSRLARFAGDPARHDDYAVRALVMFHLLERRWADAEALADWIVAAPVFSAVVAARADPRHWAHERLERLVAGGQLRRRGARLELA